jgi:hypothetical protein
MEFLRKFFSGQEEPTERQIRRATKQVTQPHGEAATRVAAMERLSSWRTAEAAAALLRRFTIQTPQASMDLEEKQYTVRLLVNMQKVACEPILRHLRTEPDVTWPVRALREILPSDEYHAALTRLLDDFSSGYTRWPEAKSVLIEHLADEAFAQVRDTVLRFLDDEDDDVCIAAIDYLVRNQDEEVRGSIIELFLAAGERPRVRGRILEHLCEKEWQVKGYRKRVEEIIELPYYLTSRGTVKRKSD